LKLTVSSFLCAGRLAMRRKGRILGRGLKLTRNLHARGELCIMSERTNPRKGIETLLCQPSAGQLREGRKG